MVRNSTLLFVSLLIFSCQNHSKKNEVFQLPSSDYVVLKYNPEWYWIFEGVTSSNLSKKELNEIETILQDAITSHNLRYDVGSNDYKHWALELDRYKRQYVPVINQKGEKVIWINFFCDDYFYKLNWREEIPIVADGGNCYFNIKINLTTKKYSDLQINGYA